jgi:uncharacterized protein
MSNKKPLPGKFVWFELYTRDAKRAQAFYGEVLGWKVSPMPMGPDYTYEMMTVGDDMIGGYAEPTGDRQPHWISYVSVKDVDATAKAAVAAGGKVIDPPTDIPGIGRFARIADPQGAELCPYKSSDDDDPDTTPTHGRWLWNELHTTDPAKAVAFYQKVFGYETRAMDMGPAGTYHILSASGQDRAGVTAHMKPGTPSHWLPYVEVDDADAAVARARRSGGTVLGEPSDIPGIGRFAIIQDPTGGVLAVMKSAPQK